MGSTEYGTYSCYGCEWWKGENKTELSFITLLWRLIDKVINERALTKKINELKQNTSEYRPEWS